MRFAICDDDVQYTAHLERELEKYPVEIDCYTSGETLIEYCAQYHQPYDAIFLDIEMDGKDGLETAMAIRKMDRRVYITFVTNYQKYMKSSFDCSPHQFIDKQNDGNKLHEVVSGIIREIGETRETFSFEYNRDTIRLYCDEIIYCDSNDHRITLHTKDGEYPLRCTLNELQQKLPPTLFCQVHRSYLINLLYVKVIREKKNEVLLYPDDTIIPVSRLYKKSLRESYFGFEERRVSI